MKRQRNSTSPIVFAPAEEIVPAALKSLKKGGALILGGIHLSPIPSFDYQLLYQERVIRSVANNTRKDGEDFLRVAAEIPIRTPREIFRSREATGISAATRKKSSPSFRVLVCHAANHAFLIQKLVIERGDRAQVDTAKNERAALS